jgi:hypothetical protein
MTPQNLLTKVMQKSEKQSITNNTAQQTGQQHLLTLLTCPCVSLANFHVTGMPTTVDFEVDGAHFGERQQSCQE